MTFDEQLKQYRETLGLERKAIAGVEQNKPVKVLGWEDDIEIPIAKGLAPTWNELELPEAPLQHKDPRWTDDEELNKQNYMEYLDQDPLIQQYGPQMESLLTELETQMMDPDNPMTPEEAQFTFTQMMEENFGQIFKGVQ